MLSGGDQISSLANKIYRLYDEMGKLANKKEGQMDVKSDLEDTKDVCEQEYFDANNLYSESTENANEAAQDEGRTYSDLKTAEGDKRSREREVEQLKTSHEQHLREIDRNKRELVDPAWEKYHEQLDLANFFKNQFATKMKDEYCKGVMDALYQTANNVMKIFISFHAQGCRLAAVIAGASAPQMNGALDLFSYLQPIGLFQNEGKQYEKMAETAQKDAVAKEGRLAELKSDGYTLAKLREGMQKLSEAVTEFVKALPAHNAAELAKADTKAAKQDALAAYKSAQKKRADATADGRHHDNAIRATDAASNKTQRELQQTEGKKAEAGRKENKKQEKKNDKLRADQIKRAEEADKKQEAAQKRQDERDKKYEAQQAAANARNNP